MKTPRSTEQYRAPRHFPATLPGRCLYVIAAAIVSAAAPAAASEPDGGGSKVTALIPRDVPPTYYLDKKTGRPAGFAVDVMDKIAERAGVRIEYRFADNWTDVFDRMKRGEAEIVPDFGITEERKKVLAYGPPLEVFQNSFFVRAKRGSIGEISNTGSVGVMSGSIPNSILATRPSLRIVRFDSYQHALFDLLAGRIDAVAGPIPTILTLARDSGVEDKIREAGPPFSEVKRAIAVRKENVRLLNLLNKATEDFIATPEYRRLYVKWYGMSAPFWSARRIVATSGLLLFAAVGSLLAWRYRSVLALNRELIKNIAERKRAEEALGITENRYRGIVESQTEFIVRYRPGGIITYVNTALAQYSGIESSDLLGRSFYPFVHEKDREAVVRSIEALTKSSPVASVENRVTLPDGRVNWQQWNHRAFFDGNGNILEYQSVGRDITERKQAEEALRTSRDFIEHILNTVDEGFIIIDRDYRIIQANRAFCAQAGMTHAEVVGKHCYQVSHRSEEPCFIAGEDCPVRDCFEKGKPFTYVHKHYGKDGTLNYTETKSYPLHNDSGMITSAIEVVNNITDKYLLEEQLLRTQKLEAIGLLAGGIAHDFNNLLQGVFGNVSLAKTYLNKEDEVYQMLDRSEAALDQATNLTRQLLTFSRGGAPVKKVIGLGPVIHNAVKFALSGSSLTCSVTTDQNLCSVEADEGQIGQVIGNVLMNANEAMPNGGTVKLTVRNATLNEKNRLTLRPGKYVRITIEDTGPGIPAAHLPKIFDPYFTTKKTGNGLGLATAHAIINKHGGVIQVRSRMGVGSTFSIYLPVSNQEALPEKVQNRNLLTGTGRILLMDDEQLVRDVAGRMIRRLGYEVEFAENGEQAIEKYARELRTSKAFAAVILDLTVPGGMGGSEAIRRMREIDPSVRGIVSSGYSEDDIVSHYREHGFQAVLPKPYQMDALGRILHTLLNHSGQGRTGPG